ncbi:MAG: extracellular solute-binding protein [Anaerolineales bacterium]|nr:extracellular solute-binding protein [Anaerolineales bacterium]
MDKKHFSLTAAVILGLLLVSCSSLPFFNPPDSGTPESELAPTSTPVAPPPTEDIVPTTTIRTTLIVWVPPQLDPASDSPAGNLFADQLNAFRSERPQIDLQVRVKAVEGPGGLLETIRAARAAAPRVLPDLIALPRNQMETAADEELLMPLDDYLGKIEGDGWYPFAASLSRFEEVTYGVPFLGDVLVLAYKSDISEDPLADWDSVLETQKALAFPAADTRSLVTLAFYQSAGGELGDLNEPPAVDRIPLLNVLNYYQQAQAGSVMPYWVTQFETDQQSWEAYRERQATLVLTWSSTYFNAESPNTSLAPFPTRDGVPYTYGTGWVWAVTSPEPERAELALRLIEELMDPDFLGSWSYELGYLPVKSSVAQTWGGNLSAPFLDKMLLSARMVPEQRILTSVGPLLRDAVLAVLKDQVEPEAAVEEFLGRVEELP